MSDNFDQKSLRKYLNDLRSESACLKYEYVRLSTLKDLPVECPFWIIRLAKNGFYNDEITDEIKCFFCDYKLDIKKDYSYTTEEHKACRMFTDKNSGNIPIHTAKKTMDLSNEASGRTLPNNPEYNELEKRQESFESCNSQKRCHYNLLALQGFFNNGASLSARCFYCGFDLRYDPRIEPFDAHAEYHDDCGFLEQEIGKEGIEMRKESYKLSQQRNAKEGHEVRQMEPCHNDENVDRIPETSSTNKMAAGSTMDFGARPKEYPQEATSFQERKNVLNCKVCRDKEVQVLFFPCRHMVTCASCAKQCEYCDKCNQKVTKKVKCVLC